MVKFFVGILFGFMIGCGYGIYATVNPIHTPLADIIHFVAKVKGLF